MNVSAVPIPKPCPARWDRMDGDDRTRFCRECRASVTDLSAMPEVEARAFVETNPTACLRYTFDRRTGAILHGRAGCGSARVRISARRTGAAAALALALAGPAHAAGVAWDSGGDTAWLTWARDTVFAAAVWLGVVDEPAVQVMGEVPVEPEWVTLGGAPPPLRMGKVALPDPEPAPTHIPELDER